MGRRIGYARVSTDDQDLSVQKSALDRDKCAIIFEEKRSGTKRDGGAQLDLALKVLIEGDTLVVTRLDRLGRSSAGHRAKRRHGDFSWARILRHSCCVRSV